MAAFDTNLSFGPFNGQTSIRNPFSFRFTKYLDRYLENITKYLESVCSRDECKRQAERKRGLFLHCAGPKVQDILETLVDSGDDFEAVGQKLLEYFESNEHHLFSIHQLRQLVQEREKSYDDYAARMKQEAVSCDFPTDWLDIKTP